MNLRALRCFVAVAEELHFGRAAERLAISQPPLTQHIKALEQELGALLFHRTKRSVRITEAGSALLDEARRLIVQADGLRQVVQRADRGQSGYLRAGLIPSSVFTDARKLYATLSRQVPGVTVMWQEMSSAEQVDALQEDKIDIAFLHTPHPPARPRGAADRARPDGDGRARPAPARQEKARRPEELRRR